MSVSGNDLLRVEGVPGEFGDGFGVDLLTLGLELGLKSLDPLEYLLVDKAMKRSGEGVKASGVTEVGISESGSNKMGGVRTGVTTLVVGVNAEVQSHKLVERRIVVPKHVGKVAGVVKRLILRHDSVEINIAVDGGGDLRED